MALLRTHPGIGLLTALALRYTLDPISRFPSTQGRHRLRRLRLCGGSIFGATPAGQH